MQRRWLKRTAWLIALGVVVLGTGWLVWPRPIPVDTALAAKEPMRVTIDDEGRTRVRHVYTVSAPVAGKVLRISHPEAHELPSLHVGDEVTAGQTVIAVIQPATPGLLDVRSRQELEAATVAAKAAVTFAEAEIRRIEAALRFSLEELARAESLARSETISARALERARFELETNEAGLASAKAVLEVRRGEHAVASARLIGPSEASATEPECCIQIRAPVSGRILKIVQQDETVVHAGAPLAEIGDPADLEVVADLLSTQAVLIAPGADVVVEGWGGPPLRGQVSRVDPAGFVKVSSLGIEERRVGTVIDIIDSPEAWRQLGHDFRVIVRVTTWQAEDALVLPLGALFRRGEEWAVYLVKDGRARIAVVQAGQRNGKPVEITSGLSEGDEVILHPSDRIAEGVAVARRQ
jgi:HlyD family secretion protein